MKFVLLQLSLCFVLIGTAQDNSANLLKVKAHYEMLTSSSCRIQYSYYLDHSSSNPHESLEGTYYRRGNAWRLELPSLTTVNDGTKSLQVDDQAKQMVLFDGKQNSKLPVINADLFIGISSQLKRTVQSGTEITYTYSPGINDPSGVEYYDLVIDTVTANMKEVRIYYTSLTVIENNTYVFRKPKLIITFSEFADNPAVEERLFRFEPYILIKDKTITSQPDYSNYQLITL